MGSNLSSIYEIDYPYFSKSNASNTEIIEMIKQKLPNVLVTRRPTLMISEIWSILEVRQLCKYLDKLLSVLKTDEAGKHMKLVENDSMIELHDDEWIQSLSEPVTTYPDSLKAETTNVIADDIWGMEIVNNRDSSWDPNTFDEKEARAEGWD